MSPLEREEVLRNRMKSEAHLRRLRELREQSEKIMDDLARTTDQLRRLIESHDLLMDLNALSEEEVEAMVREIEESA